MKKYKKSEPITTTELCKYGCGNIARYKSPSGILICESSPNKCSVNKEKNSKGGKESHSSVTEFLKHMYMLICQ